jgi:hypothetical protein
MHTGYRSLGCMHRIDTLPSADLLAPSAAVGWNSGRIQWPACVNQGPVPMHERLRTELRSRGSWRPVDDDNLLLV